MKRSALGALAVLAAICTAPGVAGAGAAGDAIFTSRVLDGVETGQVLRYDMIRTGPEAPGFRAIPDGAVTVEMRADETDGRDAIVTMHQLGGKRTLHPFPDNAGNPILMVFMESTLRSMAQITGGSPFYLRNRMREALRFKGALEPVEATLDGAPITASRAVFHPFAEDPNRPKMGAFADLEISFVVSEAVPGLFLSFAARTPEGTGAFVEEITFEGVEAVQ